jgi:hypothetical protein
VVDATGSTQNVIDDQASAPDDLVHHAAPRPKCGGIGAPSHRDWATARLPLLLAERGLPRQGTDLSFKGSKVKDFDGIVAEGGGDWRRR